MSDKGLEFVTEIIKTWLDNIGVETLFIEPGNPWEDGFIKSVNGKIRDELLNGEIFDTMCEAEIVTEQWRNHYNTIC
ncbi:MAG: transposase [Bacteroidetes bacterium]|nr:transposase [Bacteroidota bacterium]